MTETPGLYDHWTHEEWLDKERRDRLDFAKQEVQRLEEQQAAGRCIPSRLILFWQNRVQELSQ